MKVRLDEVSIDEDIYPRLVERGGRFVPRISGKTIESYVEAIKGGAVFPPIEVQRIRIHLEEEGETVEKLICLDGWHRILAYKEYNKWIETEKREKEEKDVKLEKITEVEAIPWKDEILDKEEYLEELRIESARRNLIHGDRLSSSDLQLQALRIVRERAIERLNGIVTELAEIFQRSVSYMSELIGEEVRKRRMSRDAQIFRIFLLGWTQEEIGELFGFSDHSAVSKIVKKFAIEVSHIRDQFYKKHKSVEEIAEFYNLDDITTWAIVLQEKDDLERFELFGRPEYQDDAPRIYNVWNFSQRDPRLGHPYPGNIPGQIAMNVLYYYTKQGDLVVDPMAGGGSTIDACLVMGRKCRAYDINPIRKDIVKWNLYDGFHERAKGCDFIFLDPPYWNLQKGSYTEESVSEVSLEEWLAFMEKVIKDSYNTVRKGGHVALIIEAMVDERGTKEFYDLPYMCMKFFEETGFKEVYRISVPITTQVKSHRDVEFAKKRKIILDVNRDLIVYRKV
jgi:DNA modification methylase